MSKNNSNQQPATSSQQPLQMVDLQSQLKEFRAELDREFSEVFETTRFIGGPKVDGFRKQLEAYLNVKHVIPCANGTDALQIAMMALGLKPGDEVIVPAFTYVATAEVIGLLGLTPVMTDVDPDTFNITPELIEAAITPKTRAIVPVHLFGQSADMEGIMDIANKHKLYVVEDNAQAIGADYTYTNGQTVKTGAIGHIGCTSFFPSKNLGCFGDGGAVMTNDDDLAGRIRMIANHGQSKQYYHDVLGLNSRLDAFQAAVLNLKLPRLDRYNHNRRKAADHYDQAFSTVDQLITPRRAANSTHVFHQYTLRLNVGANAPEVRNQLQAHLSEQGIPSMIYYPVPLYKQGAFSSYWPGGTLPVTEQLCDTVFSIPMHSEHTEESLGRVVEGVKGFFN